MKTLEKSLTLIFLGISSILMTTCKKDDNNEPVDQPPVLTTDVFYIATTTATSGGNITSDGGASISARGVCWGSSQNPTITGNKTTDGSGTGPFKSLITGLNASTKYFVRAYATNSEGTAYGNEVTFTTPGTVNDMDGNTYHIANIGTQVWMKENLRTTKFNDGTSIPLITDNTDLLNLRTPGYCWYNYDEATYKNSYGALYNWYVINTGKICPMGWHVPADAEWTTLVNYLGGETFAGGKLKETGYVHWASPNMGATNESGFTALPGGLLYPEGFVLNESNGYWWSSTEETFTTAWCLGMFYNIAGVGRFYANFGKFDGLSVRCIKD